MRDREQAHAACKDVVGPLDGVVDLTAKLRAEASFYFFVKIRYLQHIRHCASRVLFIHTRMVYQVEHTAGFRYSLSF